MKQFLLFISFFLLAFTLIAQQEEFKNWRLGTTFSINFNNNSDIDGSDGNYSIISYGLQGGHQFTDRLEMEIGFEFSQKKDLRSSGCCAECDCLSIGPRRIRDLKYLDISVIGNYYFKRFNKAELFAATGILFSYLRSKNPENFLLSPSIPLYKQSTVNPVFRLGAAFKLPNNIHLRYQISYITGAKIFNLHNATRVSRFNTGIAIGCKF